MNKVWKIKPNNIFSIYNVLNIVKIYYKQVWKCFNDFWKYYYLQYYNLKVTPYAPPERKSDHSDRESEKVYGRLLRNSKAHRGKKCYQIFKVGPCFCNEISQNEEKNQNVQFLKRCTCLETAAKMRKNGQFCLANKMMRARCCYY